MNPNALEGQMLGKYRVLEPLGRGGMPQVYRAYHSQLDRYVAIKVLRTDLTDQDEFLARFRREARSVANLRHPNIVQIFDFDIKDDLYYMVMELLEGDTLKAFLNSYRIRGEFIPLEEIVRILTDILEGLAYAHDEGIVHRDIKPANILLTRRGQAVLTDFGIAQILGGTKYTVSGAIMGTLHYMAPEQGLEGHCDQRSDIYSLGIVLYEMLTGEPPFDADTPLAILMKHVNDPLPVPRKQNQPIPAPFERVVLKALSKRAADRYQNAGEMAEALRQAAKEAIIDVPDRITLVLPPDPAAAPVSAPVYSGTSRQVLVGASFAADDTEAALSERIEKELKGLGQRLEQEFGKLGRQAPPPPAGAPVPPLPVFAPFLAPDAAKDGARLQIAVTSDSSPSTATAALTGVGAIVMVTSFAILFSAFTGFDFMGYAWPVEMFAVGILLSLLMVSLRIPWMLIPAGIVIGTGVILSFFTLTGQWGMWPLWMLEPVLVFGSIIMASWLAQQGEAGQRASRRLGWGLTMLSAIFISGLTLLSIFASLVFG